MGRRTARPRGAERTEGHPPAMAIIEAHGLARTFVSRRRNVEAVRGVDLQVADGEIVGFLGPNGAGKTTTLRMLTTLLSPTAGTATVCGADLRRHPLSVRRRIGYVPQAIGITAGGSDPNVGFSIIADWRRGDRALPRHSG
jgi:ABC-2 type transport system ATP-binding protein